MRFSCKLLLIFYGLGVAMIFVWVHWTNKAGYRWIWTGPKPYSLTSYDMVADARQRLESDYQANDLNGLAEKWLKAFYDAPAKDKEYIKLQGKQAVALAEFRQGRIRQAKYMSDSDFVTWLRAAPNFELVFPDKANLDAASRKQLFDEWRLTISVPKEWNERIQYSKIDFQRIAMELVSLTAVCAVALLRRFENRDPNPLLNFKTRRTSSNPGGDFVIPGLPDMCFQLFLERSHPGRVILLGHSDTANRPLQPE